MLYNKDWDKPEVKADPFSLESLIAWLEKTPARKYSYIKCRECLLSQYFTEMGYRDVTLSPNSLCHASGHVELPPHFDAIAIGPHHQYTTNPTGWTFGAALTRAREALANRP